MERSEFLARLCKILEEDSLSDDQEIFPKSWDSLEIMSAIALIDKAGRRVQVADILKCRSVGELTDLACAP